jgi:alkylhydroperoxidase family enzyme
MARIPLVDPDKAPPENRAALERLPKLDIFRMMAHAETAFRPLLRLGDAILSQQQLDPKLREFAILQAAQHTPGEYEWIQHVPIAKAAGATDAQIEALARADVGADCFDELESLVVRFNQQALANTAVDADLFEAVGKRLSPREIVELLITLGYYAMLARLTEVTGLAPNPPTDAPVVGPRRG